MRVLIGHEFSGRVREAFKSRGHDAYSCDLLETEIPGQHFQCDIFEAIRAAWWDLAIFFPTCRYLAVSGARWNKSDDRQTEQLKAIAHVRDLWSCEIPAIAIENPVGVLSTRWRKPDQIIQPYEHGHPETKRTCLWIRGLPLLVPTYIVEGRKPRVHYESPGPDRWKRRSRTLPGIANAMAAQWGQVADSTANRNMQQST